MKCCRHTINKLGPRWMMSLWVCNHLDWKNNGVMIWSREFRNIICSGSEENGFCLKTNWIIEAKVHPEVIYCSGSMGESVTMKMKTLEFLKLWIIQNKRNKKKRQNKRNKKKRKKRNKKKRVNAEKEEIIGLRNFLQCKVRFREKEEGEKED